jgi:hypothetical protein
MYVLILGIVYHLIFTAMLTQILGSGISEIGEKPGR